MTNVTIIGASGRISRHVIDGLNGRNDVALTLFARDARRITSVPEGATVVEGDASDPSALAEAIRGQDVVYANLGGDVDQQARAIIDVMDREGVRRLVFVTSLGILDEVPGAFGEWNRQMIGGMLGGLRVASDLIEASDLDYTILRPAWLSDSDSTSYEITQRDEPFRGTEISRRAVAAFVIDLIDNPTQQLRTNLGVNEPGTDGDKPSFM